MTSSAAGAADGPRLVIDQRGGNLALDLFVVDQHLGAMLDVALAGTGVTPAQYAVYSQLGRGARTPGQLADVLGVRPATLSGYLATMQERDHLTRTRSALDGRSALVALTPEGTAQRNSCRLRVRRAVTALNAAIGSADAVAVLRSALGDLDHAIVSTTAALSAKRR
jgi:DNA-binding MarR family transcriptional regulator